MKYLHDQLKNHKGKIVWLASYPKSGNTWFRCFLSALFTGDIDLAKINTDGIFSDRYVFDAIANVDSRLLLDMEIYNMIDRVFEQKAKDSEKLLFIKAHEAYILNQLGNPIFPTNVTHKVIYLVRNPLDIIGSLANHNATTIEDTIKLVNNPKGYLAGYEEGLNVNVQFRQLVFDWSGHVKSWTEQNNIDVLLVRYEDMLANPVETFTKIIGNLEIDAKQSDIANAVELTSFSKLKSKEEKDGFKERNIKTESFFRSGKKGTYKEELTQAQIDNIKIIHADIMKKLNYI